MKINNINSYNNYNSIKEVKLANVAKNPLNSINNNVRTSFSGFDPTIIFPRSIAQIREDAKSNSYSIVNKANEVREDSQNIFQNGADKYSDAQDLIMFGQDTYFNEFKSENGNLHIRFDKFNDDSDEIDTMLEFDKFGKLTRKTVFSPDLVPIVIMEYNNLDKKYSEYSFENGVENLKYMSGIDLMGSEDYKVDKRYSFELGKINRYEEKILHIGELDESKDIFEFNSDSDFEYVSQERRYSKGSFYKKEIYSFVDDKLKTYTKDSNVIPGQYHSNMGITIQYSD